MVCGTFAAAQGLPLTVYCPAFEEKTERGCVSTAVLKPAIGYESD